MASIVEGRILEKEEGLRASFSGEEQPYVRATLARLDDPDRHVEVRIVGEVALPEGPGDTLRLELLRAVTDRRAGVVRFDCRRI